MHIKHYLYNAFLIETADYNIAIDPGGKFLHWFSMKTLIPKAEWKGITHIFATHGDPDHYWHIDRVAVASKAKIVLSNKMVKQDDGERYFLSPRKKGLSFETSVLNLHTVSVDETIEIDGLNVTGVKTTHGPLKIKIGPFSKTMTPGPAERVGWGSIGFRIRFDGHDIVNLGDTLLDLDEWSALDQPEVLMVPIGGRAIGNTMDESDALKAVEAIRPRVVIPMHYNFPAVFSSRYNPADDYAFKLAVEELGCECRIMNYGDEVSV